MYSDAPLGDMKCYSFIISISLTMMSMMSNNENEHLEGKFVYPF